MFKAIGYFMMALIGVVVVIFVLEAANVTAFGIFGPRMAAAQYDVRLNSASFIDSQNMAAGNAVAEYYAVNTQYLAAKTAGNTELAKGFQQQMEAIATSICLLVQPLAATPDKIAPTVRDFLQNEGCVSN